MALDNPLAPECSSFTGGSLQIPAELDLTDADQVSGKENGRSAEVGKKYVGLILTGQHEFMVGASMALMSQYYEAKLLGRRSSGTPELDAFVHEDMRKARSVLTDHAKLSVLNISLRSQDHENPL